MLSGVLLKTLAFVALGACDAAGAVAGVEDIDAAAVARRVDAVVVDLGVSAHGEVANGDAAALAYGGGHRRRCCRGSWCLH